MAVYNTQSGNKLRIDEGHNTFINGKCINPLSSSAVRLHDRALNELKFEATVLETVQITGHIPSFSYGHGDEKVIVNTGHKAW